MLLTEVRKSLDRYKLDELKQLIVEMYKSIPKNMREDKGIDSMISDFDSHRKAGEKGAKKQTLDFNQLKKEVELFIEYANEQYYLVPNRYVHKKDRPKWRFKVKSYINDLSSVHSDSVDGKTATDLLKQLFKMLSHACGYYLFRTEDPFNSVGIEQKELLSMVLSRMVAEDISPASVKEMIDLVVSSNVDRETLTSTLIIKLIEVLKTPDLKYRAIEQCKVIMEETLRQKQVRKVFSQSEYYYDEKVEHTSETVFRLHAALCEFEEAADYYRKHVHRRDAEISLYLLLYLLGEYGRMDLWIREYESAINRGIKPRESLKSKYAELIKTKTNRNG